LSQNKKTGLTDLAPKFFGQQHATLLSPVALRVPLHHARLRIMKRAGLLGDRGREGGASERQIASVS
jgi:hypothetical protein